MVLVCSNILFAQPTTIDSLQTLNSTEEEISTKKVKPIKAEKKHSPGQAGLYSAVLPGLGQVYNKKYWKVPLVYAIGGFMIYRTLQLNDTYKGYTCAYENLLTDENFDISTCQSNIDWSTISSNSSSTMLTLKDDARRQRDMFILYSTLVYVMNIVDAIVDAHLWEFSVSDDLSINTMPVIKIGNRSSYYGGQISLNF